MVQSQLNDTPSWVSDQVPVERPSPARIYDYLLGGYHNFECDRDVVDQMLTQYPEMKEAAQVNRGFLRRAIQYLLNQGVDQFLDIGSGIPTIGNVHELVQAANPKGHVVYVDIDPIAVAHSKAILMDYPNAAAIRADFRETDQILNNQNVNSLIDFSRPVGLMLVAVVHYVIDDEDARFAVQQLKEAIAIGSYLALSHPVDLASPNNIDELNAAFQKAADAKIFTIEQITQFFAGFDIIEPGIVFAPQWHAESPDDLGIEYLENR